MLVQNELALQWERLHEQVLRRLQTQAVATVNSTPSVLWFEPLLDSLKDCSDQCQACLEGSCSQECYASLWLRYVTVLHIDAGVCVHGP